MIDCNFLLSLHQFYKLRIYCLDEYKYTPNTSRFLEYPYLQDEHISSSLSSFLIRCCSDSMTFCFFFKIYCFLWDFWVWMVLRFSSSFFTKYSCTCTLIILPYWKYFIISKQIKGILPS